MQFPLQILLVGTSPLLHPIGSGRQISLTSILRRASYTWPSSWMSTPGRWWAGRWQLTFARSWWWTPWRWLSGGESLLQGLYITLIAEYSTQPSHSTGGLKRLVSCRPWVG